MINAVSEVGLLTQGTHIYTWIDEFYVYGSVYTNRYRLPQVVWLAYTVKGFLLYTLHWNYWLLLRTNFTRPGEMCHLFFAQDFVNPYSPHWYSFFLHFLCSCHSNKHSRSNRSHFILDQDMIFPFPQ